MAKPKPGSATFPRCETGQTGTGYFIGGLAVAVGAMVIGKLFEAYPTEGATLSIIVAIVLLSLLGRWIVNRVLPVLEDLKALRRARQRHMRRMRSGRGFTGVAYRR